MLAFNAIKYYDKVKYELEKLDESINYMKNNNITKQKQNILNSILNGSVSVTSTDFHYIVKRINNESEKLIKNYNDLFRDFKKGFDILIFFGKLNEVKMNYYILCNRYNYTDKNIVLLLENLEDLAKLYQNIIQNEEPKNIIDFFEDVEKVCSEFCLVKGEIISFIESLEDRQDNVNNSNGKFLELQLLDSKFNVGEFGTILVQLNDSYNSLKTLFVGNIANLEIVKIESGSLLSKILGDKNIIELLRLIIYMIAEEMYMSFTERGKLKKASEVMDLISNSADVIEKLESVGINTEEAKDSIKDCMNTATNNIYKILSKSGKIMLDDEIISISNSQKLIDYKTLYLTNNELEKNKGDKDA